MYLLNEGTKGTVFNGGTPRSSETLWKRATYIAGYLHVVEHWLGSFFATN